MSIFKRFAVPFSRLMESITVWHKLPFVPAVLTLGGYRDFAREHNLFDTERSPPTLPPRQLGDHREADGAFNDLECPWMGMTGARFGRNVPISKTYGELPPLLDTPSPRRVSRELLARDHGFIGVEHLNVLVPAWIQFMVHDWLSHEPNDPKGPAHVIPLCPNDDWPHKPMRVLQTRPDAPRDADRNQPTAYRNTETHWWDGSQLYGSSQARQDVVRSGGNGPVRGDGKLPLDGRELLPLEPGSAFQSLELTGMNNNWWIGLSIMHTLFVREHNAIVDRLRADYPEATGEWLFQKARLVNAALLAKIHTTEWTPALLNSPEGRFVMRGNWWGVLGEHYSRLFGRLSDSEIVSGIPGSDKDHHTAPYAITEEFTAVYRMHSLIPDTYSFRRHQDNGSICERHFNDVAANAHDLYAHVSFEDVVYSLATSHPGALVLHNYPQALRRLDRTATDGMHIDLAAVDIFRDRERGVPRYCEFRRRLGMKAPRTWEELTPHKDAREQIKRVYDGVLENVDTLVGMHCEKLPNGFGFSDTAFRIFILMASRRLKSDRFFTTDFTPEMYTPAGFAWVRDNSMRTVLQRHVPALAPHFADARNVFFPWTPGKNGA